MEDKEIRLLRADEIECRVAVINEKGLSLLLFKDARVDQKILDETFTPFGWKRSHQSIDGNLYCTVEVWDRETGQWIAKQDVGIPSYSEKEKGQASDSFKRACFNWGVGRELYTAPFIWITAAHANIQKKGEKYTTGERFHVQEIRYNDRREITGLVIVNSQGKRVYEFQEKEPGKETKPSGIHMEALQRELERTGVAMETVLERYHIREASQLTMPMYTNAMNSLKKTGTKKAA